MELILTCELFEALIHNKPALAHHTADLTLHKNRGITDEGATYNQ